MPRLGDGLGALVEGRGFASTVKLSQRLSQHPDTFVPMVGHFCPIITG